MDVYRQKISYMNVRLRMYKTVLLFKCRRHLCKVSMLFFFDNLPKDVLKNLVESCIFLIHLHWESGFRSLGLGSGPKNRLSNGIWAHFRPGKW